MSFWRNIARLKVWSDRGRQYVSWLNFLMLIKLVGWEWWYLFIIPIGIVFMYIDIKHVYPEEVEYNVTRAKSMRDLFKGDK